MSGHAPRNAASVPRPASAGPALVASGPKRRRHTEDDIQRAVVLHLRTRGVPGLVFFHPFNGALLGGKKNQRGIPIQALRAKGLGVQPGVSDLILLHRGRFFALELKAPGGRPTQAQMEFVTNVYAAGGCSCIAVGLDAALLVLKKWGLLRGEVQ